MSQLIKSVREFHVSIRGLAVRVGNLERQASNPLGVGAAVGRFLELSADPEPMDVGPGVQVATGGFPVNEITRLALLTALSRLLEERLSTEVLAPRQGEVGTTWAELAPRFGPPLIGQIERMGLSIEPLEVKTAVYPLFELAQKSLLRFDNLVAEVRSREKAEAIVCRVIDVVKAARNLRPDRAPATEEVAACSAS